MKYLSKIGQTILDSLVWFTKHLNHIIYFFFIINLFVAAINPSWLTKFNVSWWVMFWVLDIWYHTVTLKREHKCDCYKGDSFTGYKCENCQKLNS